MKIKNMSYYYYDFILNNGVNRRVIFINILTQNNKWGWGEIAPLPNWSHETLEDVEKELNQKQQKFMEIDWTITNYLDEIKQLNLFPSAAFGLESVFFSIFDIRSSQYIATSALLMGTIEQIKQQAILRLKEGYKSAKLKVSQLSFAEATQIINELKNKFYLRIDVNRAWTTSQAMQFFSQFPMDTFDYVEEPFENPKDLSIFPHPLAIDESLPSVLKFDDLELLPTLKAIIYKPTIQGGLAECLPIYTWAKNHKVALILSSSFESELGLAKIVALAQQLALDAPIGIGTYHYLNQFIHHSPLQFANSLVKTLHSFQIKRFLKCEKSLKFVKKYNCS